MDEFRARRVVDSLRDRGVNAQLLRGGNGKFGIRLPLPGGREAQWDSDYGQPVAHQRTVAPTLAPALPREGGVFRRFLDGFRYRLPSPGRRTAGKSPQGRT